MVLGREMMEDWGSTASVRDDVEDWREELGCAAVIWRACQWARGFVEDGSGIETLQLILPC